MPVHDTSMGGSYREFPTTHWSMILEARDRTSPGYLRAINELCQLYWKPIYAFIRASRAMGNEDAKDLTQEFLCELVDGNLMKRFSPKVGSFHNYLRGALRMFLLEYHRKSTAKRRGGDRKPLALDDEEIRTIEKHTLTVGASAEEIFDRQWANSVLDHAVGDLRKELFDADKEIYFRVFDRYELNPPSPPPPTYAQLADEFAIKETDVSNYLTHCHRRLRELVVRRILDYVGDENEIASELKRLFSR